VISLRFQTGNWYYTVCSRTFFKMHARLKSVFERGGINVLRLVSDKLVFIQVVLIRTWRVFLVVKLFFLCCGGLLYYSFCYDSSRSSAYSFK
jgi:hypothetical protein